MVGLASLLAVTAQNNPPAEAPPATDATANPPPASVAVATDTNTAAETDAAEGTNQPVAGGIPQIKFSDVRITTAIENLARLANINYMLDPTIGYGQPDANGKIKPEPVLSIRWENITAENALLALLDNYGLQLVEDKKTGIDKITLKDPKALPPLFTKVVQLKYAGVSNIIVAAQSVLTDPRSKVLTDPRTSQLVVVATDPEQQAVETLITKLDTPTRQVLIETRLVEINTNPKSQKGVDWTGTLQAQTIKFGNTLSGGISYNTAQGFTPDIGYLSADGLSVVLSYLNSSADAQVMSTPRIVTLDNEEAKISVTRGYPVFNVQAGTTQTAGGSSVTYSNVGTVLHVTPRISANDYIWLHVLPEVSSFFGNFSQTTGGGTADNPTQILTAPVFDSRSIETQVLIPNANTLVLGGLVQDNPRQSTTKVPILGDVPGLGFFFRSSDKEVNKDNLLIFITPTIVKDSDFTTSDSAKFLKSKPISMRQPLEPNTAWDGPEPPGHWSDPVTETQK
jgi:type II secretory pathway component GspD/PulD (secretin)